MPTQIFERVAVPLGICAERFGEKPTAPARLRPQVDQSAPDAGVRALTSKTECGGLALKIKTTIPEEKIRRGNLRRIA